MVTKFICKSKINDEYWLTDSRGRRIPLEIALLTTLSHRNIVEVVDFFENDCYFQMVMEKHGAGMDLFEFIDRRPEMDEALTSYLFKQVIIYL